VQLLYLAESLCGTALALTARAAAATGDILHLAKNCFNIKGKPIRGGSKLMNLKETPENVSWPETHYVFVEKIGPFQNTAQQAWGEFVKLIPAISEHNQVKNMMSLYKVGPKVYRAGAALAAAPQQLPPRLRYEKFQGGKYAKFVLGGSYLQLPQASGRVFEIVAEKKIQLRDDYCIENYANDPRVTPEDKLITEILVPAV
jgi:effector-binding domain-containing protein